jgi:branched-subunit amino acid ABC-type transport system permease component
MAVKEHLMPFSQIILNSIIRGSQLGLLALGVTMIFAVLRFANFAHGEFAVVGAYLALLFSSTIGLPLLPAAIIAAGLTGLLAVCSDHLIFKKIRKAPGLVLLIAAMGLSMTLRNVVSGIWGPDPLSYEKALGKSFAIFGARITSTQIMILAVAVAAMVSFHILLHRTKLGKAMRALSDNTSLAQARGINVENIIRWVWFICGCYAGLGGILIALETLLWPELGFNILLAVFCAAILGGIGNVYGAVIGAMVLGFVENFGLFIDWSNLFSWFGLMEAGTFFQTPTGYKPAIAFITLVVVLIFRPTGILKGQKGD